MKFCTPNVGLGTPPVGMFVPPLPLVVLPPLPLLPPLARAFGAKMPRPLVATSAPAAKIAPVPNSRVLADLDRRFHAKYM